ncbi:MAG: 6,7-dimethyl-8-ribityllumazine synthase [Thermaerobacter sp.]|nr:6,7-dimethyl-8-ribityllumazine synthase [Thermaerobacter sp.]
MAVYQGRYLAQDNQRYAVVASRFNQRVTENLVAGALDVFARHGLGAQAVDVVWVPGAFELGGVTRQLALRPYAAIVTLGTIVRGDTPHFDFVAGQTATAIATLARDSRMPIIFGVLTCDTMAQAEDRAGGKSGNKGAEAALSAIEMADLYQSLAGLR